MKTIRYQILRQGFIQMQICCNLSPEEMKERKHELEEMLPEAGTFNGWQIELEDEEFKPVKCADDPNYWHYIAFC